MSALTGKVAEYLYVQFAANGYKPWLSLPPTTQEYYQSKAKDILTMVHQEINLLLSKAKVE